MCGFVVVDSALDAADDLCAAIAHRGPDSTGHASRNQGEARITIHFRRLAIVDLDPRSDQPFGTPGRGLLAYNGEIYNAGELRGVLSGRGVRLRTHGDTEVLYELLLQPDATALLDRVDGMFAFVLARPDGTLLVGRDRFGVKPLYEAYDARGDVVAISSEIAPLVRAGVAGGVDALAVASAAMFLWPPPPMTGWSAVRAAPAGVVRTYRMGPNQQPRVVWTAPEPVAGLPIVEAVRESVRRQVQADVPVALLLSGGVDSSWLAVELERLGFRGEVFSARASAVDRQHEPFADDAPFAGRLAGELGFDITWADLDAALLRNVPELNRVTEVPFGDPAALTLLQLARASRKSATVLLSGVGVEEVFLGYERYQAVRVLQSVPPRVRSIAARSIAVAPTSSRFNERATKMARLAAGDVVDWSWLSQSYYSAAEWSLLCPDVPLERVVDRHREVMDESLRRGASPLAALAATDQKLFLQGLNLLYADRSSMRASVELRVPFLGEPVVAAAAAMSAEDHVGLRRGKKLFRAAATSAGVPEYVTRRSKTGFGAPVRTLLRTRGPEIWGAISQSAVFDDLFDRAYACHLFNEHWTGQQPRGLALFGLVAIASWWEQFVGGDGSVAEALSAIT